jgi:SAM-dependent methyltransferase
MSDDKAISLFYELFSGLPREGPGDPECTRRALSMLPPLGPRARILDLGCGTGAQTLVLAHHTPATILAIDNHPPFIDELNAAAARAGLASRVEARVGDLRHLDLPERHFDVIWSEGAIYNAGFDAGLEAWRAFLASRGHVVVSELCWLVADPPRECVEFLAAEYPAARDIEENLAALVRCGYDSVGHFRLPSSAWWRDYYDPLARNVGAFRASHRGDEVAEAIAAQTEREIEMFRKYSDCYGYVFFVMQDRLERQPAGTEPPARR